MVGTCKSDFEFPLMRLGICQILKRSERGYHIWVLVVHRDSDNAFGHECFMDSLKICAFIKFYNTCPNDMPFGPL